MLPKLARNRYVIGAAKYAAAAAGLSVAYFGVAKLKEKFQDRHDNHVKEKLTEYVPAAVIDQIQDDDYLDIVYRLLEFRGLNATAFKKPSQQSRICARSRQRLRNPTTLP